MFSIWAIVTRLIPLPTSDDDGSTSERQPRLDLAGDPVSRPRTTVERLGHVDDDWNLPVNSWLERGRRWRVPTTSTTTGTARWRVDTNTDITVQKMYLRRLTDNQRHVSVRLVDSSSRQWPTNSEWRSDNPATVFVAGDTDWKLCRLSWDTLPNDVSLQQRSDSILLRKFVHEADRNSAGITRSENC